MQSPMTNVDFGPDPNYVPPPKLFGKPVKPNKYPACEQVYNDYYECVLVKEASFGKFFGRCNKAKELLDACNVVQQKIVRKKNFEMAKLKNQIVSEKMKEYKEAAEAKASKEAKG